MSTRDERLARNQDLFRTANEALHGAVADRIPAAGTVPFLCECNDDGCMGSVSLTLSTYEDVRAHQNRFVIVTGHPTITGEKVVSHGDGYSIVEKGNDQQRGSHRQERDPLP